jgi:uncharacterized protein YjiS (DUF1127 family)
MLSLSEFGRFLDRRARLKSYQALRAELENFSNADLADMGAKRYQLGTAARAKALK